MGKVLPDEDHVSRYCPPTRVGGDGVPTSDAFKLKERETYLSVNWLEYFGEAALDSAVEKVITAFEEKRYRLSKNGCFAILNVRAARAAIESLRASNLEIEVRHEPFPDDPSHSGIFGYVEDEILNLQLAAELRSLVDRDKDVYSTLRQDSGFG